MSEGPVGTLVLLPGMDGTGHLFSAFTAQLGHELDVRIIRYPTTQVLGYGDLADLVAQALPTDKPYSLLAESFSGPLGVLTAAWQPKHLRKLVLCCSFAACPRPWLRPLRSLMQFMPLPPLNMLSLALMGRHGNDELQTALASSLAEVAPAVMRARAKAVLDINVLAALEKIRIPTLYLRASEDRVVPKAASELIAAHKPDTSVMELAGPHFLLQTKPAEAARAVQSFLGPLNAKRPRRAF